MDSVCLLRGPPRGPRTTCSREAPPIARSTGGIAKQCQPGTQRCPPSPLAKDSVTHPPCCYRCSISAIKSSKASSSSSAAWKAGRGGSGTSCGSPSSSSESTHICEFTPSS